MENPLKPLTPEEQAIFEARRESGAVVQNKCAGCGAWYESDKGPEEYQATFHCECGTRLSYTVPALEFSAIASLPMPTAIDPASPDARLDTGMRVEEAVRRARHWWDGQGRKLMRAKVTKAGEIQQSGIANGETWDMLTREECLNVVKAWHHFFVRVPEVIGTPEHEHKIGRPN